MSDDHRLTRMLDPQHVHGVAADSPGFAQALGEPFRERARLYACPKCGGQGLQARPPWLAHDQATWTDSGSGPYPCVRCDGKGYLMLDAPDDGG